MSYESAEVWSAVLRPFPIRNSRGQACLGQPLGRIVASRLSRSAIALP